MINPATSLSRFLQPVAYGHIERMVSILISMGIAFWLPLHFLYEPDQIPHAQLFELFTGFLGCCLIFFRTQNRRRGTVEGIHSRAGLVLDLIGTFPVVLLLVFAGVSPAVFPALAAGLLTKILFLKYLRSIKRLTDSYSSLHPIFYRLMPLMLTVPVIVHWMACGWIALGSGTAGADTNPSLEYTRAIYWAFTTLTTVGYGDISARTIPQMIYACGSQVAGVGFFGFVLSNVAALLARLDAAREHHLTRLDRIETFMHYHNIQGDLRSNIRGFFQFVWQNNKGYADDQILEDLPQHLRTEVSFSLHHELIQQVPLLKDANPIAARELISDLKPLICVPQEEIFRAGDRATAMYFIKSGRVEVQTDKGECIATLSAGQFFGEMALVSQSDRSAAAIAMTYVELSVLSKETFQITLERHPDFRHAVERTIHERKQPSIRTQAVSPTPEKKTAA